MNKKQIEKIVAKLKGLVTRIEKAGRPRNHEIEAKIGLLRSADLRQDAARDQILDVRRGRAPSPRSWASIRKSWKRRRPRSQNGRKKIERSRGRGQALRKIRLRRTYKDIHERQSAWPSGPRASWSRPTCAWWCRDRQVKYANRGLQFLDLIQEGKHRPHEGGRQVRVQARLQILDLCGSWWIRQAITRAIIADQAREHHPHSGALHDRDHQQAHPHRAARYLVQELGRESRRPKRSREKMELPLDKVRKVLKIAKRADLSRDADRRRRRFWHLGDFIEDKLASSRRATPVISMNLAEQTRKVLATLTPREEKVLAVMRFGRTARRATTRWKRQFGSGLRGITRERIRQIEAEGAGASSVIPAAPAPQVVRRKLTSSLSIFFAAEARSRTRRIF